MRSRRVKEEKGEYKNTILVEGRHSSSTTDNSPTFSMLHTRHLYLTTIRDIEELEQRTCIKCRAYTTYRYRYKVNKVFRFYNISEWSNINCFEINNL